LKPLVLLALLGASLAACAPSDGPSAGDIARVARAGVPVVELTPASIAALGTPPRHGGLASLGRAAYVPDVIKPGDAIEVTVFDTGEDPMFDAGNVGRVELGTYTISPSGTVTLPFVGTLNLAGRTTQAAQRIVTERLREEAVNPFASVNIVRAATDTFTIQGGVGAPGNFPLTARGETVLDAVAVAGGAEAEPATTSVTVIRGGRRGTQLLSQIIEDGRQNVPLQPGDTVVVGGAGATVIADGALASPGPISFAPGTLSLADAVSQSGGLIATRADPDRVYVFRNQRPGESFLLAQRDGEGPPRRVTGPLILRAMWDDPLAQLRADAFGMRDGDIVYVGDAPLAAFARFFKTFTAPLEPPAAPG
jgi:polysaccharide export outer membrane protein